MRPHLLIASLWLIGCGAPSQNAHSEKAQPTSLGGPGPSCPGSGWYCGGDGVGGDATHLYYCPKSSSTSIDLGGCADGVCTPQPNGSPDRCDGGQSLSVTPAVTYPGYGWWCGQSLAGGLANHLYFFDENYATDLGLCTNGCQINTSAADTCKPKPSAPRRGLWIWSLTGRADSPSVVAAKAAAVGVRFVVIQASNPPGDAVWSDNFNANVVSQFTSHGIDVYGMTWVIPDDPSKMTAKIATAAAIANVPGVKGVIMDSEWQWFGHNSDATTLCRGTRAKAPGKFVGYSATFNYYAPGGQYTGNAQYFPQFPWHEFDGGCGDGFFPQSYFSEQSNPDPVAMWNFTANGAHSLGLKAPIWAITDFNDHQVSVDDLDLFFALAGDHASLWRYPYPDDALRAVNDSQLDQIHWSANSGDAGLGSCSSRGFWCGKGGGSPAGGSPNTLYFCPGSGDWLTMQQCNRCYSCPSGLPDTCDPQIAASKGCS